MMLSRILAMAALTAAAAAPLPSAALEDAAAAQWETHQVTFHYSGFTTDYTCDGIRHKVKLLLRAVGARDDVRVSGGCAGDWARVQPFHNLKLAFALPVPAAEGAPPGETFPAQWREVNLADNRDLEGGDCELVEQFSEQILPLLNARAVEDDVACVPRKANPHQPRLSMTLLMPLKEEQEAAAATD